MAVALRSEVLVVRPRFTTPAFDGPEERIREDVPEFDIKGNYEGGRNQEQSNGDYTRIYIPSRLRGRRRIGGG